MATTTNSDFNTMLKDYMPYDLLREELMKRDYFLSNVEKDDAWRGGEMQIPFKGGKASSMAFGQLTSAAAITEDRPVRGTVSGYKELWGSMTFNDQDLQKHDTLEQSFIKILPETLEEFVDDMKEMVSINLLNGSHVCSLTAASASAVGLFVVDRPARLQIGQYVEIGAAGGAAPVNNTGYVSRIDLSTKTVTLVTAQSDVEPNTNIKDFSGGGDDLAATDKVYILGAQAGLETFTSLRDQLLSLANSGSANLFGIEKLKYPHLQAHNADGSAITATSILSVIFDAFNETRTIGKGKPSVAIMSFKNLAVAMKELEVSREYTVKDRAASAFGWTEIDVVGVKGSLKLVGVQEMDDDIIHLLDWRGIKLHSNGMFERRTSPDGKQFYETRASSGYTYIVDTRFFGELVVSKPSHSGIIYNISF